MIRNALGALCASVIYLASNSMSAHAQGAWDPDYEPPRMADGKPSFQGIWTNSTLTNLERSAPFTDLVVSEDLVEMVETGREQMQEDGLKPTDPDAPPPEAGQNVGGYNGFYLDIGSRIMRVDGEARSSVIVDPQDGMVPWNEAGKVLIADVLDGVNTWMSDPEARPAGERCTVGYGSVGGAPMLTVLYNNIYQFAQEPDTLAIVVEMNHNTRLIRIGDEHRPDNMIGWLGDSVARWEGDTLVVHTINFHPGNYFRGVIRHRFYLGKNAEVEERFTRVSDDEIFYEFTVTDPDYYSQPWKGELMFHQTEERMYEYACHESNYSLPGILAGARQEEQAAMKASGAH